MALLGDDYASSEDEAVVVPTIATKPSLSITNAAPDVSIEDHSRLQLMISQPTSTSTQLTYNARYDDISRPNQGPVNPFKAEIGNAITKKNIPTGFAEEVALSHSTFKAQHQGFTKADKVNGVKRKRENRGATDIVDGEGAYKGPWARFQNDFEEQETREAAEDAELASDEEWVEESIVPQNLGAMPKESVAFTDDAAGGETTTFHGSQEFDYQGRTYMHVPQDLDVDLRKEPGSQTCYIPKQTIHTWKSHTKPVTALRFMPNSGHLLLSSSADTKIKIWDVYHDRELLRTYAGHTKAVTDVTFNPDGTNFLSASFDRQMKLWDTETGKCISKFTTGKIPHVIKFNPSSDSNHEFLAGMSDKKIVQYDTRSGELVQEYDHHLGPVNTITFVDEDRRFITTSDDKSLRAWEYNIPVPIKFVAEPYMFALSRAALHPSGKFVAFQSGDNQIVVYGATDRFRQNRKKSYRGHNCAGYAIDVSVSPDGQFLSSGDTGGYVCFWDWKTCKMYHKFKASEQPVTCVQWNPQETSKVATAGLDGLIKYWD